MRTLRTWLAVIAFTLGGAGIVLMSSPVLAQEAPAEEAPADEGEAGAEAYNSSDLSEEGFVPAEEGEAEEVPGAPYLIAAYVAFWALIFGYLFSVIRRQRTVTDDLGELLKKVEDIDDRLDELER